MQKIHFAMKVNRFEKWSLNWRFTSMMMCTLRLQGSPRSMVRLPTMTFTFSYVLLALFRIFWSLDDSYEIGVVICTPTVFNRTQWKRKKKREYPAFNNYKFLMGIFFRDDFRIIIAFDHRKRLLSANFRCSLVEKNNHPICDYRLQLFSWEATQRAIIDQCCVRVKRFSNNADLYVAYSIMSH